MGNSVKLKRYVHGKVGKASWQIEPEVAAWLSACEIAKAAIDCPSEDVIVNVLSGLRDAGFDLNDPLPHREHLEMPGQTLAMSVGRFQVLHGEKIGVPAVAALIRLGIDLESPDPVEKISPIQKAASSGSINVAKAMADAGLSLLGRKNEKGLHVDPGDSPLALLLESSHKWASERFADREEIRARSLQEGNALLDRGLDELEKAFSSGQAKREDWLTALGAAALQGMIFSDDSRSKCLERLDAMGLDWLAPIEETQHANEYGRRRLEALRVHDIEKPTLALAAWRASLSYYGNCETAWEVMAERLSSKGARLADPRSITLAKKNISEILGDGVNLDWEERADWVGRMAGLISKFKEAAKQDCLEPIVSVASNEKQKKSKETGETDSVKFLGQCLAATENAMSNSPKEWSALKKKDKSRLAGKVAQKTHELALALGDCEELMKSPKHLDLAGKIFAKEVLREGSFTLNSDDDMENDDEEENYASVLRANPSASWSPRVEASVLALEAFAKLGEGPASFAKALMSALGDAAVKACPKSGSGRALASASCIAWLDMAKGFGCDGLGKVGSSWVLAIGKMGRNWRDDDDADALVSMLEAKVIQIDLGQAAKGSKKPSLRV